MNFVKVSGHILRLEVSVYNVLGVKSVVEVTVNSKEGNSEDFFPYYVQEFGLRIQFQLLPLCKTFCVQTDIHKKCCASYII
jgi:hypothetical protein